MKKTGFSLAEILIAVALLGVIAAVTIPSLNANVMESQYIASFKNTHNTISDKLDAAMAFEDVNDIRNLKAFGETSVSAKFFKELKGYLNMNEISGDHVIHAMNGGSAEYKKWTSSNTKQLHNKAFIHFENISHVPPKDAETAKNIRANGGKLIRRNGIIWIDTNGYTKPNRLGHDVFKFYLGQDGRLYPYGGSDVSLFDSEGKSAEDNSWVKGGSYACKKGTAGVGCAGRLHDEGKINYFKVEKEKKAETKTPTT